MSLLDSKTYLEDLHTAVGAAKGLDRLSGATVLITGATGLIGSFVADMLLAANREAGLHVRVLAAGRDPERIRQRFAGAGDGLLPVAYDLLKPAVLPEASDYVLHAASPADPASFASTPVEILAGLVTGTHGLLEYARRCGAKRFLFVSSGEVYGRMPEGTEAFREEDAGFVDPQSPRSAYPNGKRAGETLCAAYTAEYGLETVAARPCHTFGATMTGSDSRAASQFLREAAAGRPVVLKSEGLQERSWCYAADCAAALLTILTEGRSMQAYNVACGTSQATIAALAEWIAETAGVPLIRENPQLATAVQGTPIQRQVLSPKKLDSLGWKACFSLNEGITRTLLTLQEMQFPVGTV